MSHKKDTGLKFWCATRVKIADDSTIHSSATSIAKVNKELQADLEIAVAWSKQNKLPINYDKTTNMVLGD